MPAYCLFNVREVTDIAKMETYRAGVRPTVEKRGGRYVVLGGPAETMEGDWRPVFPVMIEFPNMAAARDWYDSADYAPLKALRLAATRGDAVFMDSPAGAP